MTTSNTDVDVAIAHERPIYNGKENVLSGVKVIADSAMQHNAQISQVDHQDGISTPPTSASDEFSSQSTGHESQLSQLSQLSQVAAVQEHLNIVGRPNLNLISTIGVKRSADGTAKHGTGRSPTSPQTKGHSRNTSAVSAASGSSRMGEVGSTTLLARALLTRFSFRLNCGRDCPTRWSKLIMDGKQTRLTK